MKASPAPECAIAELGILSAADPGQFGPAELADIDAADWYLVSSDNDPRYQVLCIDTGSMPWWPFDVGPSALDECEIDVLTAVYQKVDHALHRWSAVDGFYTA